MTRLAELERAVHQNELAVAAVQLWLAQLLPSLVALELMALPDDLDDARSTALGDLRSIVADDVTGGLLAEANAKLEEARAELDEYLEADLHQHLRAA